MRSEFSTDLGLEANDSIALVRRILQCWCDGQHGSRFPTSLSGVPQTVCKTRCFEMSFALFGQHQIQKNAALGLASALILCWWSLLWCRRWL